MEAAREKWGRTIPGTDDALWTWCLEQDKSDKPDSGRFQHADTLAATLGLDMKAWFAPTAENYFSRVSKPQNLKGMQEARGTPPAPAWEKMKKAELAALA